MSLNIYKDPRRSEIEPMHFYLRLWAQDQRDKPARYQSPLAAMMSSVRNHKKRREDIRKGLVLGEPIRLSPMDRLILAKKVDEIMNDRDLWRGHYRDKVVLLVYYYRSNEVLGKAGKELNVPWWVIEREVRNALYYFSTLWSDE